MERIDLTKILRDCPQGTKLYSPLFGEVTLYEITAGVNYPIKVRDIENDIVEFTMYGQYIKCEYGECMLFPTKDNRDWSTFGDKPQQTKFATFQKVLARDNDNEQWTPQLFSHYSENLEYPYICMGVAYKMCIAYEGNEHLRETTIAPKQYAAINH